MQPGAATPQAGDQNWCMAVPRRHRQCRIKQDLFASHVLTAFKDSLQRMWKSAANRYSKGF
jgi:hypothetical protein